MTDQGEQEDIGGTSAAAENTPAWPTPPQYDTSRRPTLVAAIPADTFNPPLDVKGKRKAAQVPPPCQRFWRRAKWSPEGTHLLAQTDSHDLDLFEYVNERFDHRLRITAPTPLLDWTWYPFARHSDPSSFCFALSARNVPVRLVDGKTGATRATYGIENHVEQFVGSGALAFSHDGASLYCGHANSLSLFALADVGTNTCSTLSLLPTKASRGRDLQRGIVSSLAVAPIYDGDGGSLLLAGEHIAVGTFTGTVGVYQRAAATVPGKWIDAAKQPTRASALCLAGWIESDGDGVMQLHFHPTSPNILFVSNRGGRAQRPIRAYDLRYMSTTPHFNQPCDKNALLAVFAVGGGDGDGNDNQSHNTIASNDKRRLQQRLWFDVDWAGQWLVAGDHSGRCTMWALSGDGSEDVDGGRVRRPTAQWELHEDTIGSVSLHPTKPLLLTVSGSRSWPDGGEIRGGKDVRATSESSSGSDDSEGGDSSDTDTDSSGSSHESDRGSKTVTTNPSCLDWYVQQGALRLWSLQAHKGTTS